jgi:hypothetical protein
MLDAPRWTNMFRRYTVRTISDRSQTENDAGDRAT